MPAFATQTEMLLQIIAICGELPVSAIHRLPMTANYRYKVIAALKRKRWIRQYSKDGIRAYRLTAAGKSFLFAQNPERFSVFLDSGHETNMYRSQLTRRLRLHAAAQVYITMINAGFSTFADEKLPLFHRESDEQLPFRAAIAYYNSYEMKSLGVEAAKVRGSRATGILLGPDKVLLVYNTGQAMMKWEGQTEIRLYALIESKLCRENNVYEDYELGGLMLGDSMDMAYQLLTSTGGYKHSSFQLNGSFSRFYYCPNTPQGEKQLQCTLNPDIIKELQTLLLSDLLPPLPGSAIEQDAVDAQGRPVLLALDFDMARIKRYHDALEMFQVQGHIFCFDFQAPVLERYIDAIIESISLEKVARRYLS